MDRGLTHVPATTVGANNGVNGCGRAWHAYGNCFNHGERGHYAPKCPHVVRERGGMYPNFG